MQNGLDRTCLPVYNIASFLKFAPPVPEFYFLRAGLMGCAATDFRKTVRRAFPDVFQVQVRPDLFLRWRPAVLFPIVRRIFRFGNASAAFRGIVIRPLTMTGQTDSAV